MTQLSWKGTHALLSNRVHRGSTHPLQCLSYNRLNVELSATLFSFITRISWYRFIPTLRGRVTRKQVAAAPLSLLPVKQRLPRRRSSWNQLSSRRC
jgi:hypothetical protein